MADKDTRDILIEVKTLINVIGERLDNFDKIIVPRAEFMVVIEELRSKHLNNQKDIEDLNRQVRNLIYKLGAGLGTLQVITALAVYLVTKG